VILTFPCGQNPDGKFYHCHGENKTDIGELSPSKGEDDPAYPAAVGYDFATGPGSVHATNLFQAWAQYAPGHNLAEKPNTKTQKERGFPAEAKGAAWR
jgi:hypothetical protein